MTSQLLFHLNAHVKQINLSNCLVIRHTYYKPVTVIELALSVYYNTVMMLCY